MSRLPKGEKMKNKNRSSPHAQAARKAAKESGNFTASWCPRPAVFRDRKKEANKRACRGKLTEVQDTSRTSIHLSV
ncbi:MAG: hypothetical protein CO042_02160 [Parcubacteria group bacterium CG_4_9_14_0_2_um_filter_41_8]|nr:MAG: hypothetical protein COW93_01900 [Parcubacteria group bacterium CG22_combo_CG10-13_8_21_14_all_41_9]PIQ78819.1 MAG: hypothetical protein COV79_04910 [Parcubacteria group bacterium CG11_big_fil_rev_8_21_14_0_20_41_14]PIZ81799.1 MAG: hypothetical protein COY02_00985 [Parcubacteria group bacterium CG_4_10_14_0_2_um_filter_41_6]PJC40740.1 MAG: hypothetical protein CO042_02160 [Parcubacteria group bacterium CG_4_9_14_0_2_um_filter_41_8]